jgi:hypothetical protein
LGSANYGADATVDDLQPFLQGSRLPSLTRLGLRNSEIADDIAKGLAGAPVLGRLKYLDLSMGTLGDDGGRALIANPALKSVEEIDLHFHYLSDAMMAEVQRALPQADLSDQQNQQEYGPYCAVSE